MISATAMPPERLRPPERLLRPPERLRRSLVAASLACGLATAAAAMDTAPSTDLPDLSAARARIYAEEYEAAAAELGALTATVRHADLYNLLAFALRKLKRYDEAARWYKEALFYDPTHRPALEYQGELFLAVGDLDHARNNLKLLRLLCHPDGCEEVRRLEAALSAAGVEPPPPS
ncbi:tetratricopeptide repeat protein [Methylobacterium sp. ID0610]|uniref:tetratricopeptide repeat protein n=1 Tax=Methylobacterium carpenticola TaxID=3344827 RepID=UPI0036B35118